MLSLPKPRIRPRAFFRLLRIRYKGYFLFAWTRFRSFVTHPFSIKQPDAGKPDTQILWWTKVIKNILLGIFIVVVSLIVGAYQIAGVTSMGWAHFSIILGGLTLFIYLWHSILSHYCVHAIELTLLSALVSFGMAYQIDKNIVQKKVAQEQEAKALQTAQQRPSVTASLVIDAITENEIKYHLQIENLGKATVNNLRVSLKTKDSSQVENMSPQPRMLPAGGKLDFLPPPLSFLREDKSGRYASLTAKVFYTAEIGGVKKNLYSQFNYTIPPHHVQPRTINPDAWEEQEDPMEPQTVKLLAQLVQPQGTISLVPFEIKQDGTPNTLRILANSKQFIFDPKLRIASFKMTTLTGRSVGLELPLPENKKRMHIVIFSWDDSKGAALSVDGTEKEDMR